MACYISPRTALAYLMKSGLSKRRIVKFADIAYTTIDRILNENRPVKEETAEKLRKAVDRRQKELAEDEKFRKENGL